MSRARRDRSAAPQVARTPLTAVEKAMTPTQAARWEMETVLWAAITAAGTAAAARLDAAGSTKLSPAAVDALAEADALRAARPHVESVIRTGPVRGALVRALGREGVVCARERWAEAQGATPEGTRQ